MDILGLRNLTVIWDACQQIQDTHPCFDINAIAVDDVATYDLFSTGECVGIFQCESPGMRRLVVDLQPRCFEDIIALLALYRPGPLGSGMVSDFISNKSGKTTVVYDLPQLEPILSDTYGMIVYQEQVMQIASEVGGFTLGESDMLRRAMGKKKKDVMDQMKDQFLAGAQKKAIPTQAAQKIFDLCYKFAEYGFNKSHSAAYAMISYQTAYLKTHHPKEYVLALMNSILGNTDRMAVYATEAKRMGIPIVPPNVNVSQYEHHLDQHRICIGLGCIKGVGEAPVEAIVSSRNLDGPFESVYDFFRRLSGVNKRVVEHLIKAGALDVLDNDRAKLLGCYEDILEKMQVSSRHSHQDQMGLFQTLDEDIYTDILAHSPHQSVSLLALLRCEKELMGDYLSAHPLDHYRDMWEATTPLASLDAEQSDVTVMGVLSNIGHRRTKTNRPFSMGEIEDFTKKITVLLFDSPKYESLQTVLRDDAIVQLTGTVGVRNGEVSIRVASATPVSSDLASKACHLDVLDDQALEDMHQIKHVCTLNRGQIPVYFHVQAHTIVASKKYWITEAAIPEFEAVLGGQSVWIE